MISRRALLAGLAAGLATPVFAKPELVVAQTPFTPDLVIERARDIASRPFEIRPQIPQEWLDLSYDEFSHIWFDTRNAIWVDQDAPVKLDLFTAGLYVERPAVINLVEGGVAKTLGFDINLFQTTDQFPDLPIGDTMGYSGFRLRAGLNDPTIFEEFMVFHGASYFRAIANKQNYGLSARGLALRTGDAGGEEFPDFTDFWIEEPALGAATFVVHALLDGPSVTGAYRFEITPGQPTQVDVTATLFPRVDLLHVGLGSLTSMFFFDETNRNRFDDFRPTVHDSEGLLMWNGNNERIWRPLANPKGVEVSAFGDTNPRGFGLMQRTRDVEAYADLEAHYQNRPSLWITPHDDWGQGAVELVEIPADKEIYDNIVAYWRPSAPMLAGSEISFGYHMAWGEEPTGLPDVSHVLNTRIGKGFDQIKTVVAIDFADHPNFPDDHAEIETAITTSAGTVSTGILQRNPGTGGLRLAFSLLPEEVTVAELRAQLFHENTPISEVWLYRWTA